MQAVRTGPDWDTGEPDLGIRAADEVIEASDDCAVTRMGTASAATTARRTKLRIEGSGWGGLAAEWARRDTKRRVDFRAGRE